MMDRAEFHIGKLTDEDVRPQETKRAEAGKSLVASITISSLQ